MSITHHNLLILFQLINIVCFCKLNFMADLRQNISSNFLSICYALLFHQSSRYFKQILPLSVCCSALWPEVLMATPVTVLDQHNAYCHKKACLSNKYSVYCECSDTGHPIMYISLLDILSFLIDNIKIKPSVNTPIASDFPSERKLYTF